MREIKIYLGQLQEERAAQDMLKQLFDFPPYYGKNLDAFYDALSELTEDTVVYLDMECDGEIILSDYAARVMQVLQDAAEENDRLQLK
ncbi:MAG: barstar family protein [Lachnospiraceae bacterium]|nr:barstar family protein [Lachnospiraceae bacterium]